jgi:hypothetical protein
LDPDTSQSLRNGHPFEGFLSEKLSRPGVNIVITLFGDFHHFSEKMAFPRKTNVTIHFFRNKQYFEQKTALFRNFFGENILTTVPGVDFMNLHFGQNISGLFFILKF